MEGAADVPVLPEDVVGVARSHRNHLVIKIRCEYGPKEDNRSRDNLRAHKARKSTAAKRDSVSARKRPQKARIMLYLAARQHPQPSI